MSNLPYLDVGALPSIDGRLAVVANAGKVGCALFGPCVNRPAGSYSVRFRVTFANVQDGRGSPWLWRLGDGQGGRSRQQG